MSTKRGPYVAQEASVRGPLIAVFPRAAEWEQARQDAGLETDGHDDMHAGELETSILLAFCPEVVRPGNETKDWVADDRPHLLTLGMAGYTKTDVIGRPSLGTTEKGTAVLRSLGRTFEPGLLGLNAGRLSSLLRSPPRPITMDYRRYGHWESRVQLIRLHAVS